MNPKIIGAKLEHLEINHSFR